MSAEAVRTNDYTSREYYSSAAPARVPTFTIPGTAAQPQTRIEEQAAPQAVAETAVATAGISLFAVLGSLIAAVLMVFVVLAQISYNEIASDIVRQNSQLDMLLEQERKFEKDFENSIDMKEVERIARDELGMTRQSPEYIPITAFVPIDSAQIIESDDKGSALKGFGSFISSLIEYFK
ncbi:MAG: hypothetical protein FWG88_00100 [Oscillospiraceae bacterium]|nr:hypothetical protein [Oscillospiraceae bacterium]